MISTRGLAVLVGFQCVGRCTWQRSCAQRPQTDPTHVQVNAGYLTLPSSSFSPESYLTRAHRFGYWGHVYTDLWERAHIHRGRGGIGLVQELYQSLTGLQMLLQFLVIANISRSVSFSFCAFAFCSSMLLSVFLRTMSSRLFHIVFWSTRELKIKLNKGWKCNCYSLQARNSN